MKYVSTIRKQFALLAFAAIAMLSPNYAFAYDANCNHKSDKVTDGVCTCGAGVMYFYTKGNDKPNFSGYPVDAFGPGASFVKVIEDGTNPKNHSEKRFAIIFTAPITKIPAGMFWDSDKLYSIDIPNSVTTIEMNAFNDCKKLEVVTLSENLENLGAYAFTNCDALTAVVIPESVQNIGACAFADCDALTSIVIPENVEKVGMDAFRGCDNLTTVVVEGEKTIINESAFEGTKVSDVSGTLEQIEAITGVAADKSKDKEPEPQEKVKELKLALSDGFDKSLYPNAKIITDSYTRENVANAWGTLCLPFAVSSDENIQYYQLSNVDLEKGVMEFSEVSSVDANTPCVFQNLSGNTTLSFSTPDPVTLQQETFVKALPVDGWSMVGSFVGSNITVESNQNLYLISNNKFLHANGWFVLKPFRAYFKYEGSVPSYAAATRFIVEVVDGESTGLKSATKVQEENDGLYDILGNRVNQMEKGRIYILNGKKVMFK